MKTMTTDLDLLGKFARDHSQDAFAALVNRHVNLVYSAALRQVRSPQLAEEIAQSVFADLASRATRLKPDTILTAWLYAVTRRTAIDVIRKESRRRLREQIAVEMTNMNATADDWTHVEPFLDEAMHTLDETDRTAVLLRFFENKTLREVGEMLGASDDAAQKRVSRAVDRLREFFAKRGVTAGASGLVIVISANAVQAAPIGLAATISNTAVLAGTTLAASTSATVTKTIAMTTLQKTIVTATVAVLAGAGIYEAREASTLRHRVQTFQQQQAPLTDQVRQLQRERDDASNRLAALGDEITNLKAEQKQAELLRLRGQVGTLRNQLATTEAKMNSPSSGFAKMMNDPAMKDFIHVKMQDVLKHRYSPLFQELKLTPEQIDKFLQLASDLGTRNAQRLAASPPAGTGPAEPAQAEAGPNAEFERQLASVLGESGMARFKEFSLEVPARATVDLLNVQLGGSKLSDEQTARLFQVVKAEPFELTHGIAGDPDQALFGSQADIDNYLRRVAESNQRVLQQAGGFLNPEQLAALNTVLTDGVNARIAQGVAFNPKR